MPQDNGPRLWPAILVMLATPLFFSTNLIFGRDVIGEVAPFTLAFFRWLLVALCLLPFALRERAAVAATMREQPRLVLVLGFLGMAVCGGVVYYALARTSATNGTLIYTTSPVMILLLEAMFRGRAIGRRETLGAAVAFSGIAVIVLRGSVEALLSLQFNAGDLLFVAAALSWAVYSVWLRSPAFAGLSNMTLLALLAGAGAALLFPVAVVEYLLGEPMPVTTSAWRGIGGIVIFASLLAFLGFQFGIRRLGATTAGVFMYLLPPYGILLAVVFLGEGLRGFHIAGIALVMGGVILATFPAAWLRRKPQPS